MGFGKKLEGSKYYLALETRLLLELGHPLIRIQKMYN